LEKDQHVMSQQSIFQIVCEKGTCQIPCQPTQDVQCCHVIVSAEEEELSVRQIVYWNIMNFRLNSLQQARRISVGQVIKNDIVR
jgi:hypothetical protein